METIIHEYRDTDREHLICLITSLQDYLVNLDPLHRLRRLPSFGEVYVDSLLSKINQAKGKIFLAKQSHKFLGCIAGIIEEQNDLDKVGKIPSRTGLILALIVHENYREHGIGTILMEKMEEYFRVNRCDVARVEVFAPNVMAHRFYNGLKYGDRSLDMIKRL
jgi:ribosomal protein S18 acetylase RimI-like enzyme